MAQSRTTFTAILTLVICCICFFSGRLASAQMVSAQVNSADRDAAVVTSVNSATRSTRVRAGVNTAQRLPAAQAATSGSEFSGALSRKTFAGSLDAFSGTNRAGSPSGFGNGGSALASFSGGMTTEPIGKKSKARSGTEAIKVGVRDVFSLLNERQARMRPGQFPDATREMFWPSPRLYVNSNSFPFKPQLPIWSPHFEKMTHLNPSYLVNGAMLRHHVLNGAGWGGINNTGLQTSDQLIAPLTQLNTKINSGLNSGLPQDALTDSLQDPLTAGN